MGASMRGFSHRYFKRLLAIQVAVMLICVTMISVPAAGTESKAEFWCGNVIIGADSIDAGISQDLFHQQTLSTTSDQSIAISFLDDSSDSAGTAGAESVSPSISQTSSDTAVATSTGFFESNYMFNPGINFGAAPVGVGQFGAANPVTTARFSASSLFYPEMVMQGNLRNHSKTNVTESYPVTLPPGKAGGATSLIQRLANEQDNKSAIGFDARDENMPVILSEDTIDYDALPDQINNTSIVDRLWRNTHQGSVLNYAFEGDAASPLWIAPMKNPNLLIDCGDPYDTIKNALVLTMPGKTLTRAFWSL